MLSKGNPLQKAQLVRLTHGQKLILSYGEGDHRVLADVSVQQIPLKSAKFVRVTINAIDPATGNAAPSEIQVNKTISAQVEHLFFPKQ